MSSLNWSEWGPILVAALAACVSAAAGGLATEIVTW